MLQQTLAIVNTLAYGSAMNKSLTPEDWITASFRALTKGGPQAIRAEAIARSLKVSKGSFYWHFADVPALKTAMLAHWSQVATNDIIEMLNIDAKNAAERLRLLVQVSTASNASKYGGLLAEAAIRDWARYDNAASQALNSVDKRRIEFVKTQFASHGMTDTQSSQCANILYAALIGLEHLSHQGLAKHNQDLAALLDILLNS